jgi:hypothetical protein
MSGKGVEMLHRHIRKLGESDIMKASSVKRKLEPFAPLEPA